MATAVRTYEPPLVKAGRPILFGRQALLADGVHGYAIEKDGLIYIPLINAVAEGSGDVGRFLDCLSERCVIVNVTSERLRGMLKRRGFACYYAEDGIFAHKTDMWRRQ